MNKKVKAIGLFIYLALGVAALLSSTNCGSKKHILGCSLEPESCQGVK